MDEGTIKARVGEAIRSKRLELGLSQEEVAHAAGISVTYLSECERGKRNLATVNLVRIAGALQWSATHLFERAGL